MARKMHESAGLRVILCTRPECAHAGVAVPDEIVTELPLATPHPPYFYCEADVLVMDRRVAFGLPCARFGLRSAARQPG